VNVPEINGENASGKGTGTGTFTGEEASRTRTSLECRPWNVGDACGPGMRS
jgi:hypothetical protein